MSKKYNLNNKSNNNINTNIEERLDSLKLIKKVDAPPYLYTRIKARIDSANQLYSTAPVQWRWAFAVTATAIIILNVSIMFQTNDIEYKRDGIKEIINDMHLSSDNNFYLNNENE